MSFETSIYTDVSAENSVDGNSGFGFQAMSEGINGTDRSHIVQHMLHAPDPFWAASHEATAQPPTITFSTVNERFYFSKGISTGKTRSGRSGNQLTAIAVTDSIDDLSPHVPAQILASSHWRLEENPSPQMDPWLSPLEIPEQFETDALFAWVGETPARISILGKIVTALESAHETKTVLVAHDEQEVLRWWSLGTLLLGYEAALKTHLRGFLADPFNTTAPCVVVHPDLLNTSLNGASVIDLTESGLETIHEISSGAEACCKWVQEMDPFDALDTIDLFRRWERAIGSERALAGAWLVSGLPQPNSNGSSAWNTAVNVVGALADAGMETDLEDYFTELSTALINHAPTKPEELTRAASAAHAALSIGSAPYADAIIDATLSGLFENPEIASRWARALNPDGSWSWEHIENKKSVAGALSALLPEIEHGEELSPLLTLLNPLREEIPVRFQEHVDEALDRAIASCLSNPEGVQDEVYGWIGGEIARNTIRDELAISAASEESSASQRINEFLVGQWDFLDPRDDVTASANPDFSAWLAAARVARSSDKLTAIDENRYLLRPNTDVLALRGINSNDSIEIYVRWLETVGSSNNLSGYLYKRLAQILSRDPENATFKEVERWVPLADALAGATNKKEIVQIRCDLIEYLDRIPTARERFNRKLNSLKPTFSRRRQDGKEKY